jgi:glutamine synthetase
MTLRGMLTFDELDGLIDAGEIDTVLVCLPDLQGRLMGKRVAAAFWQDEVGHHGMECCDYLVANDTDMNTVPGYRFTNYNLGYGDMRAVPDLATIRRVPWIPQTALVLCDLADVDTGAPIEESPRRILQRQVARALAAGYVTKIGSELEFYLFRDSFEEARAKGYRDLVPHSDWMLDYHILQTTRDEYVVGAIRRGLEGAGVPVEFSKGEAGYGQHEINLRYATAVEMADRNVIYKNAAKEIAAGLGRAVTFMAKWSSEHTGSSNHIHSSIWDPTGTTSLTAGDDGHASDTFRWWLGGLMATARELSLLYAPNVNSYKRYQSLSWAPTAIAWGVDNRTLGFRVVGHGPSLRVECRVPGADSNSYLAFAATIAAGLWGIEHRIEPPPPYQGNGYEATDVARIPTSLPEALALWEDSEMARAAFGEDVHHHLANFARQEWQRFLSAVTDWERLQYFERW